jgi:subtilisin family serine protease
MKRIVYLLTPLAFGLLAGPIAPAAAAADASLDDLDAKIVQLSKKVSTAEDVIRALGEPKQYLWGEKTFKKDNLPATYIARYPQGLSVLVSGGEVSELRAEEPGPGFTWGGKLRLGSSLEEVLNVLGPPSRTVVGEPLGFVTNVLYKDFGGEKGYCYYSRPDQNVRLFFHDYKVSALYVTVTPDSGGGGNDFTTVTSIEGVKDYQDVRFKDMSKLDLSARLGLPATLWFNQKTVWPANMPVATADLLTGAMNPGLSVRKLHQDGLTGKGVNVAIIDQPLYQDHPEISGKIAAYQDVGCESESSMHGPAVASLLVGTKCGTAPDARIYYVAAPSWTADTAYYAKALDWIIEQNAQLPAKEKIRVVSVSAAPSGPGSPFKKNTEQWDPACERAEKAGILVLDCTSHHGCIGPCYYDAADPENISKCKPGFPSRPSLDAPTGSQSQRILVPCSPRTTAEEYVKGQCGYQYCGQGGLSWSIPYCAGVLALGWQARPDLTAQEMRQLVFQSAHKTTDGWLIINPPEFIRLVKAYHL